MAIRAIPIPENVNISEIAAELEMQETGDIWAQPRYVTDSKGYAQDSNSLEVALYEMPVLRHVYQVRGKGYTQDYAIEVHNPYLYMKAYKTFKRRCKYRGYGEALVSFGRSMGIRHGHRKRGKLFGRSTAEG